MILAPNETTPRIKEAQSIIYIFPHTEILKMRKNLKANFLNSSVKRFM
jgi:hypothetical protein